MVSTLLPLLLSTAYFGGDLDGPRLSPNRLLDQNFGLSLSPEQLLLSRYYYALPPSSSILRDRAGVGSSLLNNYYRPWNELLRQQDGDRGHRRGGVSRVKYDDNEFRVHLDVQQFKPEEIEVSVDEERRHLVIKAKHEEKKDEHGLISRQFVRRYGLPDRVELDRVASEISSDGVLTIRAPLKPLDKEEKKEQVRRIEIEYTGKPALKEQQTEEEEKKQTEQDDDEISITTEEPEMGSGASSSTTASSASTTEKQQ